MAESKCCAQCAKHTLRTQAQKKSVTQSPKADRRASARLAGNAGYFKPYCIRGQPGDRGVHGRKLSRPQKVKRFRALYPQGRVERFYSDSLSDSPMASLAEKAYLVTKGECVLWPQGDNQRVK